LKAARDASGAKPTKDITMSERATPITPTVLFIGDQRHPWRMPPIYRWTVVYHTPTTVRVKTAKEEMTRHQHLLYCLPDDAAWSRVEAARITFQQELDALAAALRELGSYAKGLEAAGGFKKADNPLCPTVVCAPDPDHTDEGSYGGDLVPDI